MAKLHDIDVNNTTTVDDIIIKEAWVHKAPNGHDTMNYILLCMYEQLFEAANGDFKVEFKEIDGKWYPCIPDLRASTSDTDTIADRLTTLEQEWGL